MTLPLTAPLPVGENRTVKDALCPAVSVTGKLSPLMLKPVPLAEAAEMVSVVPPEFVSVSVSDFEVPFCTFPNARLAGFATRSPCDAPVPDRAIVKLGFEPSDVMVTLPLTAPLAAGVKVTVKVVLCPAVSVTGKLSPLKLNPVPLADAAEIVTLDPPLLVSVSDKLALLPTCTEPKLKLVGLADKVPWLTPVPLNAIVRVGLEPFDVIVTLPLAAPLVAGENSTVYDVLWPAVSVTGRLNPLRLNPLPLALAAEMIRVVPPEFVKVPFSDFDVPTCTLPKLKLLGFDPS